MSPAADQIGRRGFLRKISRFGALISGVLVGLPVIRSFISPALAKPSASKWIKVAEDIALIDIEVPVRADFVLQQNDAWVETVTQNSVWLYTEDGETFKAYNAKCTHLGCSFNYSKDLGTFLCPCHRGQFDVKTGAVLSGPPPRPLDALAVEIRDSAVYVEYRDFRLGIAEKKEA